MLLLQMAAGLMVVEGVAEEQCVHLMVGGEAGLGELVLVAD